MKNIKKGLSLLLALALVFSVLMTSAVMSVSATTGVTPTALTINPTDEAVVSIGKRIFIRAVVSPYNADATLTYEIADTSIATTDKFGQVTGKKAGSTTMTIKTVNNLSDTVTIKVVGEQNNYALDSNGDPNNLSADRVMGVTIDNQVVKTNAGTDTVDAKLSWTAYSGAAKYDVYQDINTPYQQKIGTGITATTLNLTGLKSKHPYKFTVRALNSAGTQIGSDGHTYAITKETEIATEKRLGWWRDARFGMFTHWGGYSSYAGVFEGENVAYEKGKWITSRGMSKEFIEQNGYKTFGNYAEWILGGARIPVNTFVAHVNENFTAENFDAKEFVGTALKAGMKYIVLTSKHHEGFAMFPSDDSWSVKDTAAGKNKDGSNRDILREIVDEVKRVNDNGQEMHFGVYYSYATDWTAYGGRGSNEQMLDDHFNDSENERYAREVVVPHLKTLVQDYGIESLWWDFAMNAGAPSNEFKYSILKDVYEAVPEGQTILMNNRMSFKTGSAFNASDYDTPEQHIPLYAPSGRTGLWETCMTLNTNWGYAKDDHTWKEKSDITMKLLDIVSKNGNFLLNVGPKADGVIPQESVDRLEAVGKWIKANNNGEAIYGSSPSPMKIQLPWGRATTKYFKDNNGNTTKTKVYFHIYSQLTSQDVNEEKDPTSQVYPTDGTLEIPNFNAAPNNMKAYFLHDNTQFDVEYNSAIKGFTVKGLPTSVPQYLDGEQVYATTLVFEYDGEAEFGAISAEENGEFELKAISAKLFTDPSDTTKTGPTYNKTEDYIGGWAAASCDADGGNGVSWMVNLTNPTNYKLKLKFGKPQNGPQPMAIKVFDRETNTLQKTITFGVKKTSDVDKDWYETMFDNNTYINAPSAATLDLSDLDPGLYRIEMIRTTATQGHINLKSLSLVPSVASANEVGIDAVHYKSTYETGEPINQGRTVVTKRYSDGSCAIINNANCTFTELPTSYDGIKKVKVATGTFLTSYNVTVKPFTSAPISTKMEAVNAKLFAPLNPPSYNTAGYIGSWTSGTSAVAFDTYMTVPSKFNLKIKYGRSNAANGNFDFVVTDLGGTPVFTKANIAFETTGGDTTYVEKNFGEIDLTTLPAGNYIVKVSRRSDTTSYINFKDMTLTPTTSQKTVSGLTINTDSVKKSYNVGDSLSITGLVATATYNDSSTGAVANPAISGFDSVVPGTKTITVSYGGKTQTFDVTVVSKPVTSLAADTSKAKTIYTTGEELSTTGVVVTATYSDSTSEVIDDFACEFTGFTSTRSGTKTVTVTYAGSTATYDVVITGESIIPQSIEIDTTNVKKKYQVGDELDTENLIITAHYADGQPDEEIPVSDRNVLITGFDSTEAGECQITVAYLQEVEQSYTVTIEGSGKTLSSISVDTTNAKTIFKKGTASLDTTGLVVKARYSDSSEKTITDFTTTGFDASANAKDQVITVTYQGKTVTYKVSIYTLGDLDEDGKVTSTDLVTLRKLILGLVTADSLNECQYAAANVDGSEGTTPTSTDLVKLRKFILGLETL